MLRTQTRMQWARGLTVTTTGLDKLEKDAIRQDVEDAGGRYSPNLSKRTTHLVTPEVVGSVTQKLAAAAGGGPGQQQRFKALQVVSRGWVSASAGLRARADETRFAPLLPPPGASVCSAELSFGSGSAPGSAQHGAGQNAGPQTPWVVHFSQLPDDSVYAAQQHHASPSAAHQLAQQLHLQLSPITEACSPAPAHADPAAGRGLGGGTWQLQAQDGARTTPDRSWQHQEQQQQQQLYRTPSGHVARCMMPAGGEGLWGASPAEEAAGSLSPRLRTRPPALHLPAGGNSGAGGGGGPAAAGSLAQQQACWRQHHMQHEQPQQPQQQEQQHAEAWSGPAAAGGSNVGDLIAALQRATGDSRRGTTGSLHSLDAAVAAAAGGAGTVASSGSTPSRRSLAGLGLSAGCLPSATGDGSINSCGGSSIETLLQSLRRLSDRTAAAAAAASEEVIAAAPAAIAAGPAGCPPPLDAVPGMQQRLSHGSGFAGHDLDHGPGEHFHQPQQQQQHAAGPHYWGSAGGYGSSGLGSSATTAGGAAEQRVGVGCGLSGVSGSLRAPSPLDLDRLLGRLHSAAHADSSRCAADGGDAVPGAGSSRAMAFDGNGSGSRPVGGESGRPPWAEVVNVSGMGDSRRGAPEAVSPRGTTNPASIGQLLGLLRRATADSRRGTAEGLAGADGSAGGDAVSVRATADSSRRTTGEVGAGSSGSRPQDIEQLLGLLHRVTADSRRGTAESLQGAASSSGLAEPGVMRPVGECAGVQAAAEAAAVPLPLSQSQAAAAARPAEMQGMQASNGVDHVWGSGLAAAALGSIIAAQHDSNQQQQYSPYHAEGGSHAGSSSVADLIAALRRATGESRRNTADVLAAAAGASAAADTDTAAGPVDASPGRRDAGRAPQKPHLTLKLPSDHDSRTADAAPVPLSHEAHASTGRSDAGGSSSSDGQQQQPLEQEEDGGGGSSSSSSSIVGLVSALQCIAAASKLQEAAAIAPEVAAITQCHAAAVQHQADLMQGSQYAELVGRLSLELSQLNERGLRSMQQQPQQHEQAQQQQQQQHCTSAVTGLDAAVDGSLSGLGAGAAATDAGTASAVGKGVGGDGGAAADALFASMSSGSQGLQRLVAALRRVTAEAAEAGVVAVTTLGDASGDTPPAAALPTSGLQPHPSSCGHTEAASRGPQATSEEARSSGLDALLSALQASSALGAGNTAAVAEATTVPLPMSQHTAAAASGSSSSSSSSGGCSEQPLPTGGLPGWSGTDSSGRKVRDLVAALEAATAASSGSSGRHWPKQAARPDTGGQQLPSTSDSGSVEQLLQQLALSAAKLQPPEEACLGSNTKRGAAPTATAAASPLPAAAAAAAAAGEPLPAEDSGLMPVPQGLLQTPEPAPDAEVAPPRSCHARRPSAENLTRSGTGSPLPPAAAVAAAAAVGQLRLGGSVSPSPPAQGLTAAAQAAAAEVLEATGSPQQGGAAERVCSTDGPAGSSPSPAGAGVSGGRGTSRSPSRLLAGGVHVQSAAGHLFLSVPEADERSRDGPATQLLLAGVIPEVSSDGPATQLLLAGVTPEVSSRPSSRSQQQPQKRERTESPGGLRSPSSHPQHTQPQQQQVLADSSEPSGTHKPTEREQQQQQPGTDSTAVAAGSPAGQQLAAGLDWCSLVVAFDRHVPAAVRQQLSEQLAAVGAAVVSGTPHLGCGANAVVAEPEAAVGLLPLLLDIISPAWLAKALKHEQQQQQQQDELPPARQAGGLPAAQRLVRLSPDVARALSLLQQPGNSPPASAAVSRQGSGALSAGQAGPGPTGQQQQVTGPAGDADNQGSSPGSRGRGCPTGGQQQPPLPVLVLPPGYAATSAGSNMPVLLQEVQSDWQQQQQQQQVLMPAALLTDQLWSVGQHPRMVAEEELEAVVLPGSLCARLTLLLPQSSGSLLGHAAVTCCPADAGKGLTCGDVLAAVHAFYQQEVLLQPDSSCGADLCQGGPDSGVPAGTQLVIKRLQLLGHKQMFEGLFRATKDPCSTVYEVCLA